MDWATGDKPQWWNDENAKPWTEQDKRDLVEKRRAAEKTQKARYAVAARKAQAAINAATMGTHQYLAEKGFPAAVGLVLAGGDLLIPMRDCVDNSLLGVQAISLENYWEKKMLHGMRAKGAVLRIGPPRATETWLVEGYATGLSVDAALRMLRLSAAVIVCFSAGNLVHVAQKLFGRLYVFADNDVSRTGEKAAIATGLPCCMSDEVGEDANDLHQRCGVMSVAKKIMSTRGK